MKYENIISLAPSRSGHLFIMSNIFSWLGCIEEWNGLKFYNLENMDPANLSNRKAFSIKPPKGLSDKDKKYYILKNRKIDFNQNVLTVVSTRDYLNWAASLIKLSKDVSQKDGDGYDYLKYRFIDLSTSDVWLNISKEVKGETNYIPNSIKIVYDDFKNNKHYRIGICNDINGIYDEKRLNKLSVVADGSSFDKLNFKNTASNMKTDERYLQMINEPSFNKYIEFINHNKEALDFYINNFHLTDDQKHFIKEYLK